MKTNLRGLPQCAAKVQGSRQAARIIAVTGLACLTLLSISPRARAVDTISVASPAYQKFDGFGASQAFDCGALALQAPDAATQSAYYNDLFKNLNLSFFRNDLKSYFSPSSGVYDYNTAIRGTGDEAVINAARARKPNIKVMFTVWSPPLYMKSNGALAGGSLLASAYDPFGAYLAEFTRQFYVNESFPVDLLSIQNEPDGNYGYDSCVYDAPTYVTALGHVSPQVRSVAAANGYATKMIGPEWSGCGSAYDAKFDPVVNIGTTGTPIANPNLDISAMHGYWGMMGDLDSQSRGLFPIYQTEWSDITHGDPTPDTGAPMASNTASQFCQDFNYGNVSAWFQWWMSWLQGGSENQALTLRAQPLNEVGNWTSYTLCKKYYAFKMLSYTFLPGSFGRYATVSTGVTGDLQAASAMGPYGLFELAAVNGSTNAHPSVQLTVAELAGTGNVNFTRTLNDANNNAATSTVTFVNGVYTDNLPAYTTITYLQQDGSGGTEAPYSTVPAIPGTVIFSNYDLGGQGVAYHVTIPSNQGGLYRTSDWVSIGSTTDGGGNGFYVGWTTPGQWLKYTVNVGTTGTYTASFRVASPNGGKAHLEDNFGNNLSGAITIPNTGSYTAWATVTASAILPAGRQILRFVEDTGGYDLNTMSFALASGGSAPGTPSGLTATGGQWSTTASTTQGQVALTWPAVSGATSYSVYRSTASNGEGTVAYMPRIFLPHYTDVGLINNTPYYYRVAAVNAFGSSILSGEASATTGLGPPSPPTGLAATPGSTQVALTWNTSAGAATYNVLRSTVSGSGYANVVSQSGTSYTNTGLTNGTPYYFVVSATNANGTSANSSPPVSATPGVQIPAPPTNLMATAGNTQVALSWTASTGATSYNVLRSTVSGSGYASVATGITVSNYTNTSLTNGTAYYFAVTATDAAGTSGNSAEATATPFVAGTQTAVNAGGPVAGVFIADAGFTGGTAATNNTGAVDTSAVTNAAPTAVYQSERYGNFTYTVSGFTANSTHTVRLHFTEDYWTGVGQRVQNVTINGANVLTNFDIYAAAGALHKAVIRQFTQNANAGGQFVVGFVPVSGSTPINAKVDGIEVINGGGGSIPAAPSGLTATAGNTQVTLSWTASTGATSYNILRSTINGSGYASVATGVTVTNYTNTGLTNGTEYYFVVTATNTSGTSGNSNQASATPSAGATLPVQINAGGPAVSPFIADTDFVGGTPATNWTGAIDTSAVASPAPQAVYQTERYGASTYTVPGLTPSTSYTVRLHFCENYFTASGLRKFNVAINSTSVLTNFDIFATAGTIHKANIQQFSATSNGSGQIVIAFTNVTDNALINGVEILNAGGPPAAPANLISTAGNAQVALTWAASGGATSYNVLRSTVSGSGYASAATGITVTNYTNTGLTNGKAYYFVVTAANAAGTSGNSAQTMATPFVAGSQTAINAGGPVAGVFAADSGFSGGTAATNNTGAVDTSAVTNPAPTAVYQSERFGNFTYTVSGFAANSTHTVRLHFTEDYWAGVGLRVQNVTINGAAALTNFDIYATAGALHKAVIQQFTVNANASGQFVIGFVPVSGSAPVNAKVDGIEVI